MRYFFILFAIAGLLINPSAAEACTGITLKSKDSTTIVARTIEWGGSNLNSQYVVVPRGYTERSASTKWVDARLSRHVMDMAWQCGAKGIYR